MEDFNAYWATESARRRKLWPARYKSFLRRHLSLEEIKTRVFNHGVNGKMPMELRQRHVCDSNPLVSLVDNRLFSEERLKRRLESIGVDTESFSLTTNVKYGLHYLQTYKDVEETTEIHLEEIVVCIKKTYRDDDETTIRYDINPYDVINNEAHMVFSQEDFLCLNIATLLMEMVADYKLRKNELFYYRKRLRIDNMYGIVAPDITYKLLDDEALRKLLKECKRNSFSMERMLGEVARPWMTATEKYITLVTEANRDMAWCTIDMDLCRELTSVFKEMDNESLVIMTEHHDIIIECLGHTYTLLGKHPWTKDSVNIQFFSDIPEITIHFDSICTKALVEYVRQATGFNKDMTEYLKKAQAMYKRIRKRYFKNIARLHEEDNAIDLVMPSTNVIMGTGSKSVYQLTIPHTVKYINNMAFSEMTHLTNIVLPQSVSYIGAGAFSNCVKLETIRLPNLLVIMSKTFCNCHHLRQVDLPSNLLSIEEEAFAQCYRLLSIVFPASLTMIKSDAFKHCSLLENLQFNSYSPEHIHIEDNAFENEVYANAIVFVPKGCEDAYSNSESFVRFQHICPIG